ncbi:nucleoside diphosphate kinase [Megavirus baoshan]|uniref:Nucleoside diphosphate kinase n=1 Tax=Megavirus baoshan TaxID=2496520 RepID=A0A3Q8U7X9_9VIRU|nr:nucleoside diphosphate kinase [Megavirus baoshan]AZL89382.1 nucleoside diphosphate kinase [Megavirus baoshan]
MEKTLVLIKPDAFARNLVGKIMHRFESKGLKIINMKYWSVTPRTLVERHYAQDKDRPYFSDNCDFMTSGPIISIIYEGQDAVSHVRRLQGTRDIPGTIRGDYVTDVRQNLVHASDSQQNANNEIAIWFP